MDLEDLLAMCEKHGNLEGPHTQIDDLEDLLREAWNLLTERQRSVFLDTDAVKTLQETTAEEE